MPNAVLKPLSPGYLDDMMGWVNNPEITGKFAKFNCGVTRQQEISHIKQMMASKTDKCFVMETEEGKYLGNISLHEIDTQAGKARMSILIAAKKERGKSYGKSAIRRLLEIAFNEMKLHKVWLIVFEENTKARGLYRQCGFQEEGILQDEYFVEGKYHNMARMAILNKRRAI
ncbi:MAG: GNAT family protein [Nanoarchaeota archaeon]|nr:GNAT family protein [Nanoarchaeota archaeon]